MDYIFIAISHLSSAVFLFYMLKIVFGDRLSAKTILIIYNLLMIGAAASYYLSTYDWIGALVTLIPYILIQLLVFNFRSLFNLNFRSRKFKKSIKSESVIYSSYDSKKLLSYVFLGVSVSLMILSASLLFLEKNGDYKMHAIIGLIVSSLLLISVVVVKLTSKKQSRDLVVLAIGQKEPKLFSYQLPKLKSREKQILADENYIVDFVGRIYVKAERSQQVIHLYLIVNDKATYQSNLFVAYQNNNLISLLSHFERYSAKELIVIEHRQSYEIKKITNL